MLQDYGHLLHFFENWFTNELSGVLVPLHSASTCILWNQTNTEIQFSVIHINALRDGWQLAAWSFNFWYMNVGKNYTASQRLSKIISFESLLDIFVCYQATLTFVAFSIDFPTVWLVGEPAGSQVHPLHGVSRADWADPQGDRSVAASTQRRLCLLLSYRLGHFHTTCRYFTFLSPTLCFTLLAVETA